MEEQIYLFEREEYLDNIKSIPQEIIEKEVILDFLKSIPTDKLKQLVGFEEINPNNQRVWYNRNRFELLRKLDHERKVRFQARIII